MKKILAIMMFLLYILSFGKCGCNNGDSKETENDETNESQYPSTAEPEGDVYFGPQYFEGDENDE
ncbi:MAG: hypothetical protein FWG34_07580 [Oscillospiraceae bacterium]|nr:hypothetical protein [Oscillospiraceae bacterium]